MTSRGIPEAVRRFVGAHIESVEALDVLLLLRERRDREWTAEAVARELRRNPGFVAACLAQLHAHALATQTGDPEPSYRYDPRGRDDDRTIEELAGCYASRRVSVISLIYSKPTDQVTTFADAFRLRKDDG